MKPWHLTSMEKVSAIQLFSFQHGHSSERGREGVREEGREERKKENERQTCAQHGFFSSRCSPDSTQGFGAT